MRNYVGITGTPGTGKKTIAPLVAYKMGLPCVSLHDEEVSSGLVRLGDDDGEVDTDRLGRFLVRHVKGQALIYGHLLPYVLGRKDCVKIAVLRCEPKTLKRRLFSRGYRNEKVVENVEAELIGVLSAYSLTKFGGERTAEFDTTKAKPKAIAEAISEFLGGGVEPGPSFDWTFGYRSAPKLRSLF